MEKYLTQGVCARQINFEVEDGRIKSIFFIGGCDGNLQGISSLVTGMRLEDVIDRLEGISCGGRPTSCPDQLAKALREYNNKNSLRKAL